MSTHSEEITQVEHDGTNQVKAKRVFLYGWDGNALAPIKITANSNGELNVAKAQSEAIRSHKVNATTYIYGYAATGSTQSSAVWQMFKIIDDGTDMAITWADGNPHYDNIWDNYASINFI